MTTKTESNPGSQFTDSPIVTIGPQSNVDKVTPTSEAWKVLVLQQLAMYTVTVPAVQTTNNGTYHFLSRYNIAAMKVQQ